MKLFRAMSSGEWADIKTHAEFRPGPPSFQVHPGEAYFAALERRYGPSGRTLLVFAAARSSVQLDLDAKPGNSDASGFAFVARLVTGSLHDW